MPFYLFTSNSRNDQIFYIHSTDDDFWNNLVTMTGRRSEQVRASKPNSYYAKYMKADLTVEEMKAFLGVRLYMEYFLVKRTYASYWRSDGKFFLSETPGYHDVFERDRFLAIWSFLHLMDEQDDTVDKTDKIYKVRGFLDTLLSKFKTYYKPKQFLSLDEGMIPCKNRLGIKQYIKDKPVKWGLKSFLLTDSTNGYIMNAEVYTGREEQLVSGLGTTGNIVMRLISNADLAHKSHILVMDRYYNSIILSSYLHSELDTGVVGTIQTNRKLFPKDIICKKLPQRGDSKFRCSDNLSVCAWMDRKPIYFVSSVHDPRDIQTARRMQKNGVAVHIDCPKAVEDYNSFMGGCDLNDQMTRLQRSRKHYKWLRRLFIKLVMWAIYNSYILYRETIPILKPSFSNYLEDLCLKLVGSYRRVDAVRKRRQGVDPEQRLLNVGHMPVFDQNVSKGHECVVCTKKRSVFSRANPDVPDRDNPHPRSKSCISCSSCKAFLCVKRGSTCWSDFHTKVEFWR